MATIEDVLDQVGGLRRDAASRVQERFGAVAELADASTEQLTAITGIGKVMADRIQTAARTAREQAAEASEQAAGAPERAAGAAARAAETSASKTVTESRSVADRVLGAVSAAVRRVTDLVTNRTR